MGRGTATERAWLFILMARQQGLDAALVALDASAVRARVAAEEQKKQSPPRKAGRPENPGLGSANRRGNSPPGPMAPVSLNDLRPWAVAVLIEGKLYLFEPALGLPIPGPGKIGRDRGGRLDIRPATLAEVAADDGLLRRLDQPRTSPYPLKAADLSRIVFLIEASPQYLAKRMQLIESRLTGKQKMALTAAPTATAHRLLAAAGGRASASSGSSHTCPCSGECNSARRRFSAA